MVNLNLSFVSVSWGNPYWDYFVEGSIIYVQMYIVSLCTSLWAFLQTSPSFDFKSDFFEFD